MLLAAGVGSRLDPLTSQLPKPLVPIANVPVMEHMLTLLKEHGVDEVYANLHYLPAQIKGYFGDGSKLGLKLFFRYEEKLSGDAGGVRALREFLEDETFLVVMGDLLTDADLAHVVRAHKEKGALASIAIKKVEDVSHFGVVVMNGEGFITGFQEKPRKEEALSDLASTGIYVLEPEVFNHIPQEGEYGFGRQLFPKLVSQGLPVLGIEITSYWSDVGTIPQYRQSNFDSLEGRVKINLPGEEVVNEARGVPASEGNGQAARNGKSSLGASRLWLCKYAEVHSAVTIDGALMVGSNSVVGKNVKIRGNVIIGDACVIEDGVELSDCVIWSGSHVEKGARINQSVIGMNCRIARHSKHEGVALVEPTAVSQSA
ncbi:MAG TPA: NDP-sugar synthase [Candidatus Obscuribacterales bacterium]